MDTRMTCRCMEAQDMDAAIGLYMDYYNTCEEGAWTYETTRRRIHQVWSREDSLCLLLERDGELLGFAMGCFEQFDDLQAYDLVEIVIARTHQGQGVGTVFMEMLEEQVRCRGGAMIQLLAVNDEKHDRFYGKLQYRNANSLVIKTKWL